MDKEEKKKSKKQKKEKDRKRRRSVEISSSTTTVQDKTPQHKDPPQQLKRTKREDGTGNEVALTPSRKDLDVSEKASKKIRIKQDPAGNQTSQLLVQVSEPSPSSDPVVVSFPAGLPSSIKSLPETNGRSVRFEDDDDDDDDSNNISSQPPVFTWTRARRASSKGKIIHGSDRTCTFISSNDGRGNDGRLTKFYVGLYHKPTSTLKLIPAAEKGTVFSMGQSVTNYNDSKSVDFSTMTYEERRRMVFESFGSVKKKKVLRSEAANTVEMRSVVGAGKGMMKALGKQMDNNLMSESNLKAMEELKNKEVTMSAVERAYAEARRSFLPPFDESAKNPYKVYDSQEVAGEEAWGQISRVVDACLHKGDEWKEAMQGKRPWPKSTRGLLDSIMDPKKKGAKYQIKTMVLVNYLVKFHNRASKKFMDGSQEELAKYLGLPREVSDRFLALFCAPTHNRGKAGFATSKQLKDRRVVYTLIMYLLSHGKNMMAGSIQKICEDMRLEMRDAMNLYRQAGCTCSKNNAGIVSVSLKVPLTFPPPKRSKKG